MNRKSGLQIQVLNLYRDFLKAIKLKERAHQPGIYQLVRKEFNKNMGIPVKEYDVIEYFLRRGHKQLLILKSDGFTKVSD
jgi:succinate dehydrogenase assembly factor 1